MIKKIILIVATVGIGLIFFTTKTKANEIYSNSNLASPVLEGKEHLGDVVYRLYNENGITLDYNVYNGLYSMVGTPTDNAFNMVNFNLTGGETYTLSAYKISGTTNNVWFSWYLDNDFYITFPNVTQQTKTLTNYSSQIFAIAGIQYNIQFKLQIEKGSTAKDYKVPLTPYAQTIDKIAYNDGRVVGYEYGYIDGYEFVLNNVFDLLTDNILTYYVDGNLDGLTTIGGLDYNYYHGGELFLNGYAITDLASFNQHLTPGKKYIFMFSNSPTYLFWSSAFHNDIKPFNLNYIIVDFIDNNNWYFYFYDAKNVLRYELNNVYLDSPFVYVPVGENPDYMYQVGLNNGRKDGYDDGYDGGYIDGVNGGYDNAYNTGYNKGVSESIESGGFTMILSSMFTSVGVLLSIELLPNISIGSIVAIPIVFGVIMFIIGRKKE